MTTVTRNVSDLSTDERRLYEGMFGQPLLDQQRVVLSLVGGPAGPRLAAPSDFAQHYAIFTDLSDADLAALETAILDRSQSRPA